MGRDTPLVCLIILTSILFTTSYFSPNYLSDAGNSFLEDFLDNDILSILGFITALGNASTLSILMHLNHLEDETNVKFARTRISLRRSAISLIYFFLIVFVALMLKPLSPPEPQFSAFFNSIGIICVFASLSVLRDLALTVFGIPTKKMIAEINRRNKEGQ